MPKPSQSGNHLPGAGPGLLRIKGGLRPEPASAQATGQVLPEEAGGQYETVLARLREFFGTRRLVVPERIFVFYRDAASELCFKQDSKECRPVNAPLAGDAVPPPVLAVDADLVKHGSDDLRILRVHCEDALAKIPRGPNGID